MLLFINVYLQEGIPSPLGMPNCRYNLPNYSKQEIFLYTLESYKTIQWSKVIIYCELDPEIENQEEYYQKILLIFPEAELYRSRNAFQSQWQEAINKLDNIDDDLIWYAGNHDHPYVASSHNQLNKLIAALEECDEIYKGAVYSHFQDNCSWIMNFPGFNYQYHNNGVGSYYTSRAEGVMIVNKALFRSWWFDYSYGDAFIPRADWLDISCQSPIAKIFLPVKQLCTHFDGYTFVSFMYDTNDVPPIMIPCGFWDYEIEIDYCSSRRHENRVWINPMIERHYAVDPNGVDYKCLLEDLPLFWKGRIQKIYTYGANPGKVKRYRNRALYNAACARRYVESMMLQKGVNWSETKEYRPKLSFSYLRELFKV